MEGMQLVDGSSRHQKYVEGRRLTAYVLHGLPAQATDVSEMDSICMGVCAVIEIEMDIRRAMTRALS